MADKRLKLKENAAGNYYVDETCIDCDMCRSTAPEFFVRDEEVGLSIVFRQPITVQEQNLAEEARSGCPNESIGNDG